VPRTFIDAGILIAAARGDDDLAIRAMEVLDDPTREFVSSAFVKLEVIPQPTYNRRQEEVDFMEDFFREVRAWAKVNEDLLRTTMEQACAYGLDAVDALHVAAAKTLEADELVTAERATKPICRVRAPRVSTIRPR